jgi:hypothetical protein
MKRREFITLLGGAAAWPVTARAQQVGRLRRIGVLMNAHEADPVQQSRAMAFEQVLRGLGWRRGQNLEIAILQRSEPLTDPRQRGMLPTKFDRLKSSTWSLRRRSASKCRRCYSPAPTR